MELHYICLSSKDIHVHHCDSIIIKFNDVDYYNIGCQSKHLPGKLPTDDKDAAEIHNEYYNKHLSVIVHYYRKGLAN